MAPDPDAIAHEVSLRSMLWCVAVVLGAVQLCFQALGA